MKRYVLEGTYSQKICHRQVTIHPEIYKDLKYIRFSNNTKLLLTIRLCLPRERVKEIKEFSELIKACLKYNVNSVSKLRR